MTTPPSAIIEQVSMAHDEPPDVLGGPGVDTAARHPAPQRRGRRAAIELRGWDRFVVEAGFTQVCAPQPDPANPGQLLRLYDVPDEVGVALGHRRARVLVADASPDSDGGRRRFGLLVPGDCPDALTAVAQTFGLDATEYVGVGRAT